MSDQSPDIKDLALALSAAQAEIGGALKDSTNPHFGSNYADLESIWSVLREPLAKHKLAVVQATDGAGDSIVLVTTLMHGTGQWIKSRTPLLLHKKDMQGLGAAITYARRFALAAIAGVFQTDDDGETAVGRGEQDQKGNPVATPRTPQAPKSAPTTGLGPEHCGGRMRISQFNPNEFYCPKCKAKAPVAA